jgi:hypothetical protein
MNKVIPWYAKKVLIVLRVQFILCKMHPVGLALCLQIGFHGLILILRIYKSIREFFVLFGDQTQDFAHARQALYH